MHMDKVRNFSEDDFGYLLCLEDNLALLFVFRKGNMKRDGFENLMGN